MRRQVTKNIKFRWRSTTGSKCTNIFVKNATSNTTTTTTTNTTSKPVKPAPPPVPVSTIAKIDTVSIRETFTRTCFDMEPALPNLNIKFDEMKSELLDKRDKSAISKRNDLQKLMSPMTNVSLDQIPDAFNNEQAANVVDVRYFSDVRPSAGSIGTNDLSKVFETVISKDYPLQALLNLLSLVNLGLSVHYARNICESLFSQWIEKSKWKRSNIVEAKTKTKEIKR